MTLTGVLIRPPSPRNVCPECGPFPWWATVLLSVAGVAIGFAIIYGLYLLAMRFLPAPAAAAPAGSYPRHYAVNDRPVVLVALPDGSLDALALDLATGAFVPDRGAFARISAAGPGKDVDALTPEEFDRAVGGLRARARVSWASTADAELPFAAEIGGERWRVRVNDFPAEPLYTLIVDGREQIDLDDWPDAWCKPG